MTNIRWFYIKSATIGQVVSVDSNANENDTLRSQVYVRRPEKTDNELWCWEGRYLVNKSSRLVLDIRKGKLRLIEDTDICVYSKKPADEASNQLWDFQNVTDDGEVVRIFSYSNNDWVLDIQFNGRGDRKLVLAPRQPFDDESQRWVFVPTAIDGNDDAALSGDMPSFEVAPIRVDAYKASHQLVFLEGNPHLSDKRIAMAAAYHVWKAWRQENALQKYHDDDNRDKSSSKAVQTHLQEMAKVEASRIFDESDQLNNHKETAISLAERLVINLYLLSPQQFI
ncbi:hypothetical protein O0I10_001908 [Lichtheimia ornata]|uniref:Ricin B lectin domain-containing protein n=1 Tax=Lichtheimia ornata TaxID=688661 RepID=A0AAD7VB40_9FUNG|nr:uncharacterized protein O0I10_001908 [Lichtheimia ornata]KAJ8662215.1 hypothetical protein O0I10_001908 [Lichtheimia ornata]